MTKRTEAKQKTEQATDHSDEQLENVASDEVQVSDAKKLKLETKVNNDHHVSPPTNSGINHRLHLDMTPEEFTIDLYAFMAARGLPITKPPSLGYQPLDLFLLYKLVIARGGMDAVTRRQEWKAVYQDLSIPTMSTSASYNTRTNYKKYLYLYELEHCTFEEDEKVDEEKVKDQEGSTVSDGKPKFAAGQFIRIVSNVWDNAVFYGRIVKKRVAQDPFDGTTKLGFWEYYVHYNGWSTSHDEWMPEAVLGTLLPSEQNDPEHLVNPTPTRSSKSNKILGDEMPALAPHLSPSGSPKPNEGSPQKPKKPLYTKPITDVTPSSPSPKRINHKHSVSDSAVSKKQSSAQHTFLPSPTSLQTNKPSPKRISPEFRDHLQSLLLEEFEDLRSFNSGVNKPPPSPKRNTKSEALKPPMTKNYQLHTGWLLYNQPEYLSKSNDPAQNPLVELTLPIDSLYPKACTTRQNTLPNPALHFQSKDSRTEEQLAKDARELSDRLKVVQQEYKDLFKHLDKAYGRHTLNQYLAMVDHEEVKKNRH